MADWRISDTHQRAADEAHADWRDSVGALTPGQRWLAERGLASEEARALRMEDTLGEGEQ